MTSSIAGKELSLKILADPKAYSPQAVPKRRDVSYCTINIAGRGPATLERYLALLHIINSIDLAIHGSVREGTRQAAHARGSVSPSEVPVLYDWTRTVRSVHCYIYFAANLPTSLIFEVAACECAILSDLLPIGREIFGDVICWTMGGADARETDAALLGFEARRLGMGRRAPETLLAYGTFDTHASRIAGFAERLRAGRDDVEAGCT